MHISINAYDSDSIRTIVVCFSSRYILQLFGTSVGLDNITATTVSTYNKILSSSSLVMIRLIHTPPSSRYFPTSPLLTNVTGENWDMLSCLGSAPLMLAMALPQAVIGSLVMIKNGYSSFVCMPCFFLTQQADRKTENQLSLELALITPTKKNTGKNT